MRWTTLKALEESSFSCLWAVSPDMIHVAKCFICSWLNEECNAKNLLAFAHNHNMVMHIGFAVQHMLTVLGVSTM